MVKILSIETSTSICSVAVHEEGELMASAEINEPGAHAERLMLLIEEVMKKAGLEFGDLDSVAVSGGPGSYTGLRIGVSTAKGLAFGLNRPLIGVGTLQALASTVVSKEGETIIPVLDAKRMEVYREVFDWKWNSLDEPKAEVLSGNSFQNLLENGKVYFLGDAVGKVKQVVENSNAIFLTDVSFSAKHMGKISWEKFKRKEFADTVYYVPNYLKEFKALHSKKNPLLSL